MNRRPIRLGAIASEFFDPRVGRMGGFGWAARMLADSFAKEPSVGVEMVFLASQIPARENATEDRLHGSRVLLRRPTRFGNLRVVQREKFDLLLTIDYHRADT